MKNKDNKEKKDLNEMRLLLESNLFEEITEDNEDRLDNFFTPFQIKLRLKVPLDNNEYNMALQCLGLRSYYEGHAIPTNPDNTAFIIKDGGNDEKYIQILIKKSMLDEIESFIEEDENFNEYMKNKCKKDFEAFINEKDFVSLAILTSGPSENFSNIITFGITEIKNNIKTDRKAQIYIDNNLTEKEIEDYITPYAEGVKSSYERTGIALPGMYECKNKDLFIDSRDFLRMYYKMCNNKNVITDDPVKVKNFISKLIEKNNLEDQYNIENISKNYISIRRVSKYIFNEYYSMYDLAKFLKYKKLLKYGSIGESEIISDLVILLKKNIKELMENSINKEKTYKI